VPQRGYEIVDPECREKPEINEVSKILAQSKRTGQPIHERLFKQEILSHKIATELLEDKEKQERIQERVRSRDNTKRSMSQHQNKQSEQNSRIKTSSRLGFINQEFDEQYLENPGVRLYQRGVQLNQEKAKLIERVKKEKEDKEFEENCTFKPKLYT